MHSISFRPTEFFCNGQTTTSWPQKIWSRIEIERKLTFNVNSKIRIFISSCSILKIVFSNYFIHSTLLFCYIYIYETFPTPPNSNFPASPKYLLQVLFKILDQDVHIFAQEFFPLRKTIPISFFQLLPTTSSPTLPLDSSYASPPTPPPTHSYFPLLLKSLQPSKNYLPAKSLAIRRQNTYQPTHQLSA